jgi:hypothetical protein
MTIPHAQTWDVLAEVLQHIDYTRDPLPDTWRRGRFVLEQMPRDNYAVLYIFTYNPNTYRRNEMRLTRHEFVVPVATYNKAAWTRWVFDRIASIEMHETAECFEVDGQRVYAPHHGNGEDPYVPWYGANPEAMKKAPGED